MSGERSEQDPLMKAEEVGAWLGFEGAAPIYKLSREQGLPFYQLGKRAKRYRRSDVELWLEGRRTVKRAGDEPAAGEACDVVDGAAHARVSLLRYDGLRRLPKRRKGSAPQA
jgi:hypothetical protein